MIHSFGRVVQDYLLRVSCIEVVIFRESFEGNSEFFRHSVILSRGEGETKIYRLFEIMLGTSSKISCFGLLYRLPLSFPPPLKKSCGLRAQKFEYSFALISVFFIIQPITYSIFLRSREHLFLYSQNSFVYILSYLKEKLNFLGKH